MPLLCRRAGARGRPMLSQGSWRGCEACLSGLNRPSGGLFAASGRWAWDAWGKLGDGAPGGIRTPDQWLRKPLLYPAELRARWPTSVAEIRPSSAVTSHGRCNFFVGGAAGTGRAGCSALRDPTYRLAMPRSLSIVSQRTSAFKRRVAGASWTIAERLRDYSLPQDNSAGTSRKQPS